MARKYTRDNRGRFASRGGGATARGGRLKTASGGQRATQKRVIISAESRKLAPASFDAASRSGKVNLSRKYGGQGQGYKSRLGLSAAKAAKTAQEAARRSKRQSGLPKSGGAMRLGNSVGAAKVRAKAAFNREKVARAAYFKTDFGTKAQTVAKSRLDRATKKADVKLNQMRAAKMARMDASARKPMRAKRTKAPAPANTVANKTGQSKTLNRFNSRPAGTMVAGKGINLVPSAKRVPVNITQKASDEAFARVATKTARSRAAAPAKAQQKQTTAQRVTRAAANQKRVTQSILAKGGKRPTPSRKQRRSIMTAEAAKRFYATGAVNTLKVNVKKPGFRLPRNMR